MTLAYIVTAWNWPFCRRVYRQYTLEPWLIDEDGSAHG